MSERTFDLPEGIDEDGQLDWVSRMSYVSTLRDGLVYVGDTVCGVYPAARVREFALALLAAADASEVPV